jgi:hypothetical protein
MEGNKDVLIAMTTFHFALVFLLTDIPSLLELVRLFLTVLISPVAFKWPESFKKVVLEVCSGSLPVFFVSTGSKLYVPYAQVNPLSPH